MQKHRLFSVDVQTLYNGDMQKCCMEGYRRDIYIDIVEMDVEQCVGV